MALGALELDVLERLWRSAEVDARAVHRALSAEHGRTLSTVQSTLNRLHRKGLLIRTKVGHAYLYATAITREKLIGDALQDLLGTLGGGRLEPIVSSFVDLADPTDAGTLARLEALVAKLRQRRT